MRKRFALTFVLFALSFVSIHAACAKAQTIFADDQPASGAIRTQQYSDAFDVFDEMQRRISQLMRDPAFEETVLGARGVMQNLGNPSQQTFRPDYDLYDAGDHYELALDLPGVEKDKINLEVRDGNLVISGERKSEQEKSEQTENGKYYFRGRDYGSFERQMKLPDDAKPEAISAKYDQGVLKVMIPKKEGAQKEQAKKIPIQ